MIDTEWAIRYADGSLTTMGYGPVAETEVRSHTAHGRELLCRQVVRTPWTTPDSPDRQPPPAAADGVERSPHVVGGDHGAGEPRPGPPVPLVDPRRTDALAEAILRHHPSVDGCTCGWSWSELDEDDVWSRHVAYQLIATGVVS